MSNVKIGVLGLQGAFAEHLKMLHQIEGVEGLIVKTNEEIDSVDGLIIPGGESTAIGKLLKDFNLLEALSEKIKGGFPVWGTCAGMILLAKEIVNNDKTYLNTMDISVRRNAYGSQLDSFITEMDIKEVSPTPIPLVFIRAPYVEKVFDGVDIIAQNEDKIIACRQKNMLATSFHPELTGDLSFHKYFIEKIVKA